MAEPIKLTDSERTILGTIYCQGLLGFWLDSTTLRKAAKLTQRGGRIVLSRMQDKSLIVQDVRDGILGYALTWRGSKAIGVKN